MAVLELLNWAMTLLLVGNLTNEFHDRKIRRNRDQRREEDGFRSKVNGTAFLRHCISGMNRSWDCIDSFGMKIYCKNSNSLFLNKSHF